jgi:hypothetical protein
MRRTCVTLLCLLLAASPALAATAQPGQGVLYLNRGQGFQPVNGAITVNPGDQLMVDPAGGATVIYPDNCAAPVRPGGVTVVGAQSPCVNPYSQNAPPPVDQTPPDNAWFGWLLIAGGGAALGWGIYEATQTSNSVSP